MRSLRNASLRTLRLIAIAALFAAAPMTLVASAGETQIESEMARAKLLGPLRLSLQWIGFGDLASMGTATVEDQG